MKNIIYLIIVEWAYPAVQDTIVGFTDTKQEAEDYIEKVMEGKKAGVGTYKMKRLTKVNIKKC